MACKYVDYYKKIDWKKREKEFFELQPVNEFHLEDLSFSQKAFFRKVSSLNRSFQNITMEFFDP